MSRSINPAPQLKIPTAFLNDREAVAFFDQQRTILFQITRELNSIDNEGNELNSSGFLSSFTQQNIKALAGLPEFTVDTTGFTADTTLITADKVIA